MTETISSLWVGDRLSTMERICALSFLKQGHPFRLYTYGPVEGVPEGVEIADAAELVPAVDISRFQNLANFSDYFRYRMLYFKGGWWVDMDTYCLRPFNFGQNYVFSTQLVVERTADQINTGMIYLGTPRDTVAAMCLRYLDDIDTSANEWAALGPAVLLRVVNEVGLNRQAQPHQVFCPLHYFEAPFNLTGSGTAAVRFPDETRAVHLWNEEWRRAGADKDATYPRDSLYEKLKREVL